jgi:hypothetical protein
MIKASKLSVVYAQLTRGNWEMLTPDRLRRALVAAALAVVLASVLDPATAAALRSLEASATGELGSVTMTASATTFTEEEGNFAIVCRTTKRARLNSRIAKVTGATFALVTSAGATECTGGTVAILGLPWAMTYVSFNGTLPNIREVRLEIRGMGFLVTTFFGLAECLYRGNVQYTTSGNPVTALTADTSRRVPLAIDLGSGICPARGYLKETLVVSPALTLRLV